MPVAHRIALSRPFVAARRFLETAIDSSLSWIAENTPVLGRAAKRRRLRVVLAPYKRIHTIRGPLLTTIAVSILLLSCIVYGIFFGLTAPYIIVPYFIPIGVLAALVVWALPPQRKPPTLPLEYLMPAFFITLILWPNYLAVSLPGLPWITLLRLIALPLDIFLLINLSVSKRFRDQLSESVNSIKLMWICVCGFMFVDVFTIAFSSAPFAAAQLTFNEFTYWIAIFFVSAIIFRDIRYIERYFSLLCCLAIPIVILVIYENSRRHIPWAAHIPSFLRISAPSVNNTLRPSFRAYTNIYRAKATFSTPLGLAEYLSLLTPLFLYFGFSSRRIIFKVAAFLMVPVLFIAIRMTDARLGVAGMVVSLLLYGSLWSIVRWRSRPRDLLSAAIVYGYPALFAAGVGAVLTRPRLNQMVFGGGAQMGSTHARSDQLGMALTALWRTPWGHGAGGSGPAMGFPPGQAITIDNYFITIALDFGVAGVIFWYGMFITAIFYGFRYCLSPTYAGTREARLLAPITVTLVALLIIKWVHGQDDNHPIYFMMLGMVSALVFNLRNGKFAPSVEELAARPAPQGPMNTGPPASAQRERGRGGWTPSAMTRWDGGNPIG